MILLHLTTAFLLVVITVSRHTSQKKQINTNKLLNNLEQLDPAIKNLQFFEEEPRKNQENIQQQSKANNRQVEPNSANVNKANNNLMDFSAEVPRVNQNDLLSANIQFDQQPPAIQEDDYQHIYPPYPEENQPQQQQNFENQQIYQLIIEEENYIPIYNQKEGQVPRDPFAFIDEDQLIINEQKAQQIANKNHKQKIEQAENQNNFNQSSVRVIPLLQSKKSIFNQPRPKIKINKQKSAFFSDSSDESLMIINKQKSQDSDSDSQIL